MKRMISILIALSIVCYCSLPIIALTKKSETIEVESNEKLQIIVEEIVVEEKKAIEEEKPSIKLPVPDVRDFKSYTNYKMLNRSSPQWTKIQTIAYSDGNGLRKVEDYYCAAMGSYYSTTLGDLFRITTETGNVFTIIMCDFKANQHTNSTHQYTSANGCIVEFYVDYTCFNARARYAGSISAISGFSGKIISIEFLGNYFTANS